MRLRFEGWHCWASAPAEHKYLASRHRHEFHVTAEKRVRHHDRDVEFIALKRRMAYWISRAYPGGELGSRSCEEIATDLLVEFGLSRCEVFEDGENGAIVRVKA